VSEGFDFAEPDRFTVGTEGPVGQRIFLLQCRQGPTLITVKAEKQQVAILASYLARIVRELGRPGHLPENVELETVAEPDWTVGTIGVSYDEDEDRIVVVLEEVGTGDDEDLDDVEDLVEIAFEEQGTEAEAPEGSVARVALNREQAAAFAIRATQLVEAGRPPCPLCGLPLDPSGHDCPRTNGHRPPVT
jgi:uncharacterized repeat protein (TIGR03847 family)